MSDVLIKDSILQKFYTTLTENIYYDQNGYLVCTDAVLGRTGSQEYTEKELGISNSNEIVDVYRLEEYVFEEDSMNSLEGRPLTLKHPKELVTIENHNKLAKGEVFNVRRVDNTIVGDIRVTDSEVAKLILDKKMRDLSLGYTQDLKYDEEKDMYYFTNIIYNHIALVKKGRAGNAMIKDEEIVMEGNEEQMEEMIKELLAKMDTINERLQKVEDACSTKDEDKEEEKVEEPKEEVVEKEEKEEEKVEDAKKIVDAINELKSAIVDSKEVVEETTKVVLDETPDDEVQVQDHDIEMQNYFYELQKTPNENEKEYMARLRNENLINHKSTSRVYTESLRNRK